MCRSAQPTLLEVFSLGQSETHFSIDADVTRFCPSDRRVGNEGRSSSSAHLEVCLFYIESADGTDGS